VFVFLWLCDVDLLPGDGRYRSTLSRARSSAVAGRCHGGTAVCSRQVLAPLQSLDGRRRRRRRRTRHRRLPGQLANYGRPM